MIRIAILDDEPLARAGVRARLQAHADVHVAAEHADGESALDGLRAAPVDLAFVDVRMPGLSGLDVLARLPPAQRPLSILLTAHDGFAVRAFELRAIDYLLKPIDDARFAEALDRARELLALRAGLRPPQAVEPVGHGRIEIRLGNRIRYVDAERIDWIEADGDYARLHVGARSHLLREPLHRLAERLDPQVFMRVHRSALVRIAMIDELQPLANRDALLRLRNGTPVRASRTYMEALLARLRDTGTGDA
ncbi:LytR/AlgR family response regulator transcription factor [Thermomonas brevis]